MFKRAKLKFEGKEVINALMLDLSAATCQRLESLMVEMRRQLIEEDSTKLSFLSLVSSFRATIYSTFRLTYDRYEPWLKSNRGNIDDIYFFYKTA